MRSQLLSTDITPETAVPTELTYGDDTATIVSFDGNEQKMPLAEFDSRVLNVEKYKLVKLELSKDLFKKIPSIRLVDMPGFDSGIEFHNRAINDYLPNSLAYIVVVAATDGTFSQSILAFLNELKIYDVPVYVIITKCAKVSESELENIKAHISDTISRFLKIDKPIIAAAESKGNRIYTNEFEVIRY